MKVRNMTSPRTGREIPNQFEIHTDDGVYFQSYKTMIAFKPFDREKPVLLDVNAWDYSRTTAKYRNQFLGENTKQTIDKIDAGTYVLEDLNP